MDGKSRWVFIVTICVGSFLLFLVQPMIAPIACNWAIEHPLLLAMAEALVIDAFSSDSVPMHLLTRKAFASKWASHSAHFEPLSGPQTVVAAATRNGWTAMIRQYEPDAKQPSNFYSKSVWVALSRDLQTLKQMEAASPAQG